MTRIVVTAGVVQQDGRFLVTRRLPGVHLEGYWEFPGGKCAAGESIAGCLERELHEELNASARVGDELLVTTHRYEDRIVELHFLRCELKSHPTPQLGQEMRCVTRDQLRRLRFPPADSELIRLLTSAGGPGSGD